MNAARVRERAGMIDVTRVINIVEVLGRVETINRPAGDRREARGALGRFRERRLECLARPSLPRRFCRRLHTSIILGTMADQGPIFAAMLEEFDGAARLLNLEPGIWKILTHPKRQIIVS